MMKNIASYAAIGIGGIGITAMYVLTVMQIIFELRAACLSPVNVVFYAIAGSYVVGGGFVFVFRQLLRLIVVINLYWGSVKLF